MGPRPARVAGKANTMKLPTATFTIDGDEHQMPQGIYTATELWADTGFARMPGGEVLFLVVADGLYTEISGTEVVRLQDGMKFVTENAKDYVVLGKAEDGFWCEIYDAEGYCTITQTAATTDTYDCALNKKMEDPGGSTTHVYIQDGEVRAK